MLNAESYFWL